MLRVSFAGEVLVPFLSNGRGREETFLTQSFSIEQLLPPIAQRSAQPRVDRNAESHFRPLDQFSRDMFVEHLAQQPFALSTFDFHRERNLPGEFHNLMVE